MFTRFKTVPGTARSALFLAALVTVCYAAETSLEKSFAHPPHSARPWVYWFELNRNITSHGITADLEAMKRVGIGGVLIMEVDQDALVGPLALMSPQWRELFKDFASERSACAWTSFCPRKTICPTSTGRRARCGGRCS